MISSNNSFGFSGSTKAPQLFSSTIFFVQPFEFTIIGLPAAKESNNLFGELVLKIGIFRNGTTEISQTFTK